LRKAIPIPLETGSIFVEGKEILNAFGKESITRGGKDREK